MYVNRVSVTDTESGKHREESVIDLVLTMLSAWHRNGQICGDDWPIVANGASLSATVLCPEEHPLDARFNNKHVIAATAHCEAEGLVTAVETLGEAADSVPACACHSPSAYLLFTTYMSLSSPIRCMDCFRPVALYHMQAMAGGEFSELLSWQSNYKSCDSLQMHCAVLERAATREISNVDSSLSEIGLAHCRTLAASSNRPFYYYLHRGHGRSLRAELERRCAGCGGEWNLSTPLHGLFDFKCDRCGLLSNVAFDVR